MRKINILNKLSTHNCKKGELMEYIITDLKKSETN